MSDPVVITIFSGFVTFVAGQIFVKLIIEPVHDMKQIIGRVSHTIVEHGAIYSNASVVSKERLEETSRLLKQLSAQLHSGLYLIPLYGVTRCLFHLPTRDCVITASRCLSGIANSAGSEHGRVLDSIQRKEQTIRKCLYIYIPADERLPGDQEWGERGE